MSGYATRKAIDQLNRVYRTLPLYLNFFQPVLRLQAKSRHGARAHKTYDTARTPYQRLLESGAVSPQQQAALRVQYEHLNPVRLKAQLDRGLDQLWSLATAQHQGLSVIPASEATIALR